MTTKSFLGRIGVTAELGLVALIATSGAGLETAIKYWSQEKYGLLFLFPRQGRRNLERLLLKLGDDFLRRIDGPQSIVSKDFYFEVHAWFGKGDLDIGVDRHSLPEFFSIDSLEDRGKKDPDYPGWYRSAWEKIDVVAPGRTKYVISRDDRVLQFFSDLPR